MLVRSLEDDMSRPRAADDFQTIRARIEELRRERTTPQPVRGKPNEPANVVATAETVADVRGVSYAELEATVEANAARIFGW